MADSTLSLDHVRQHERMEMEYWRDFYEAVPPAVAARFGHAIETAEGAYLAIIRKVDVLMFNRVLGLGLEKPVTQAQLDGIVVRYKGAGVPRFFVPLSPAAEPAEVREWLLARGLRRYNRWAKLERGVDAIPEVSTDATIEEVGPESASAFARVLRGGFDLPEGFEPWVEAMIGRPGWRHYMAWLGGEPVGTGSLYVKGEWASLGFAATLPSARGRGVQSALIVRRMKDAASMGCRCLSVETAEDNPEKPAPSFHNVTRLGFKVGYHRDNYLWEAEGAKP
jgi:GNAT superfamily N-acetyltransferase